jgi:hypothetical protein
MDLGNVSVELRRGRPHAATMMIPLRTFGVFGGLLLLGAVPASACSPTPGYVIPSNLDLADEADSIVLARIERQRRPENGNSMPRVMVRPVEAIKGPLPRGLISVRGYVGSIPYVRASYSDPDELTEPHPQSFDGVCTRYVFMPGSTLLLFLKRDGDSWKPIRPPFSRTFEDVPSRRSRWVKAVRLYARVSLLPAEQQVEALMQEQAALRRRNSRDAHAIADDIDRVLAQRQTPPVTSPE